MVMAMDSETTDSSDLVGPFTMGVQPAYVGEYIVEMYSGRRTIWTWSGDRWLVDYDARCRAIQWYGQAKPDEEDGL
jgi:hypothetical protein